MALSLYGKLRAINGFLFKRALLTGGTTGDILERGMFLRC